MDLNLYNHREGVQEQLSSTLELFRTSFQAHKAHIAAEIRQVVLSDVHSCFSAGIANLHQTFTVALDDLEGKIKTTVLDIEKRMSVLESKNEYLKEGLSKYEERLNEVEKRTAESRGRDSANEKLQLKTIDAIKILEANQIKIYQQYCEVKTKIEATETVVVKRVGAELVEQARKDLSLRINELQKALDDVHLRTHFIGKKVEYIEGVDIDRKLKEFKSKTNSEQDELLDRLNSSTSKLNIELSQLRRRIEGLEARAS